MFLATLAYLVAPILMMLSEKADMLDVVICLLVPPPINWIYAAWVLL
jgi:hypothetical protein